MESLWQNGVPNEAEVDRRDPGSGVSNCINSSLEIRLVPSEAKTGATSSNLLIQVDNSYSRGSLVSLGIGFPAIEPTSQMIQITEVEVLHPTSVNFFNHWGQL